MVMCLQPICFLSIWFKKYLFVNNFYCAPKFVPSHKAFILQSLKTATKQSNAKHNLKFCFFSNFQWLVACAGGRPPAFGVATGNCPCCLQPVTCSNKDG